MNIFALWLLLLLAGCVHQPPPAPPAPDIAQLQAQHRYVDALAALDSSARAAPGSIPEYDARRDELVEAARVYQEQLLVDAGELARNQQFTEAQRMLADARPQLPPTPELDRFAENLESAAAHYRQRNLDEIVQLRSAILLKEQPLYRALQKAADTPELQQLLERQRLDAEFFAAQLVQLGARALAQNELTRATQYLGQANQLAPSEEIARQLKRAEQSLAASKQKRQTARSTEREQHYREQSAALEQNIQQREYLAARAQLEQLKSLGIRSDEVEQLQEQLDQEIGRFVEQQIDAGNRLYSDGHLEDAIKHWREAAALTPSPQLTERMEKAQRFIDRLEQLRAKKY
jgi:hypothetical protein